MAFTAPNNGFANVAGASAINLAIGPGPFLHGDIVLAWVATLTHTGGLTFTWPAGWILLEKFDATAAGLGTCELRAFLCVGGETFAAPVAINASSVGNYHAWAIGFSGTNGVALIHGHQENDAAANQTITFTNPPGPPGLEVWVNLSEIAIAAPGGGWAQIGASWWRGVAKAVNPDPQVFTPLAPPGDMVSAFVGGSLANRGFDSGLGGYW